MYHGLWRLVSNTFLEHRCPVDLDERPVAILIFLAVTHLDRAGSPLNRAAVVVVGLRAPSSGRLAWFVWT